MLQNNLANILANLALVAFALSSIFYLISFSQKSWRSERGKIAFSLFFAGTGFVVAAFIFSFLSEEKNISSSLPVSYLLGSALGLLQTLMHMRFRVRSLGLLIAPINTLILMAHFFSSPAGLQADHVKNYQTPFALAAFHIGFSVIGIAFALLSWACAVFYLLQRRALKTKRFDRLGEETPALDLYERLLVTTLWIGFILLSFGLVTGAVMTKNYIESIDYSLSLKIVWAVLVWLCYLITIAARNFFNYPPVRIANLSFLGFFMLALSYFGLMFYA